MTQEYAATHSIGHVVKTAVRRYSEKAERDYFQALYERVKGEWLNTLKVILLLPCVNIYTYTESYNHYMKLGGATTGAGGDRTFRQKNKICTIADNIPLLPFLSGKW